TYTPNWTCPPGPPRPCSRWSTVSSGHRAFTRCRDRHGCVRSPQTRGAAMNDTAKIGEYAAVPAELVTWPALEIARAVRDRRLAPEAVIRAHLARIDEADPRLHAFPAVRPD